jgi:hypothetical protein
MDNPDQTGRKTNWHLFGPVELYYKDRYLFTLTARADGSSKFGANNKWSSSFFCGGLESF